MKLKRVLWNLLQIALVVGLLYYVILPLLKNAKGFQDTFLTLKPLPLVSGILVLSLVILCYPFVWRYILGSFGIQIPWKKAVISWIYSNVGKYMPGKVWQFVGRVALTKSVKPEITLATVFLEVIISSSSAVMVFFARFFLMRDISPLWSLYAVLLFVVLFFLQHPAVVKFFLKLYFKVRKQEVDLVSLELPLKRNVYVFFAYFILWILTGVSFWLMVQGSNIKVGLVDSVTTYPISWILGYLTLISPGGLGVRESILMSMLKARYAVEVASAFSLLTRLALVFTDFFLFFLVLILFGGLTFERKQDSKA